MASARTVLGDTTDVADLVEADAAAAAASATAAAGSASTAATQATNAKNSATTASTKAGEASGSATTAANHASAASGSAAAASTSAQTASSAKTAAEAARDKANLYANAPAGTEVSTGEFSAKHWAAQAQAAATGSLIYMGSWDASTGKYPANPVKGHFYKVIGEGTISGTQAALDAKANTSHIHTIANVTNLQTELDSKVLLTSGVDWQAGVKDIAVCRTRKSHVLIA